MSENKQKSNIQVAIRVRPMQQKEIQSKEQKVVRIDKNLIVT